MNSFAHAAILKAGGREWARGADPSPQAGARVPNPHTGGGRYTPPQYGGYGGPVSSRTHTPREGEGEGTDRPPY